MSGFVGFDSLGLVDFLPPLKSSEISPCVLGLVIWVSLVRPSVVPLVDFSLSFEPFRDGPSVVLESGYGLSPVRIWSTTPSPDRPFMVLLPVFFTGTHLVILITNP